MTRLCFGTFTHRDRPWCERSHDARDSSYTRSPAITLNHVVRITKKRETRAIIAHQRRVLEDSASVRTHVLAHSLADIKHGGSSPIRSLP